MKKENKKYLKRKGFTLLEIIIAITLLTFLLVLGINKTREDISYRVAQTVTTEESVSYVLSALEWYKQFYGEYPQDLSFMKTPPNFPSWIDFSYHNDENGVYLCLDASNIDKTLYGVYTDLQKKYSDTVFVISTSQCPSTTNSYPDSFPSDVYGTLWIVQAQ